MSASAGDIAAAVEIACAALEAGANMIDALSEQTALDRRACVEIAYALQSGSYTAGRDLAPVRAYRAEIHGELSALFEQYDCRSVMDMGAGEATSWRGWTRALDHLCLVDLSLNRLRWAPANLAGAPVREITRVKADMAHPPAAPLGFDAVTTMHALEPNGPSAAGLVEAIAGCAARLLVLFEPDYASADPAMRARMERHGYARDIMDAAGRLGDFELVARRALTASVNPANATTMIALARRDPPQRPAPGRLADPVRRAPLYAVEGGLEDAAGALVYPTLYGVHCLSPADGVLLGRV